jgi:hypothetical protein
VEAREREKEIEKEGLSWVSSGGFDGGCETRMTIRYRGVCGKLDTAASRSRLQNTET